MDISIPESDKTIKRVILRDKAQTRSSDLRFKLEYWAIWLGFVILNSGLIIFVQLTT